MAIFPSITDEYFMPSLLDPAPSDIDTSDYGSKIRDPLIVKKFENTCTLMRSVLYWSV